MFIQSNPSISTVFQSFVEPNSSLAALQLGSFNPRAAVNSLTTLSLTGASNSLSSTIGQLVESLDRVTGTATLTDGILSTDLSTPFGVLQESYNLVELGEIALDSFKGVAGVLDLSQGVASGTINLGDGNGDRPGSILFAELISNTVEGLVADLDGTIILQNGQFLIDLPTRLGAIQGTLDISSGKLVSDLTTPLGDLDFTIDFPESAQFDLPLGNGLSGVLNLDQGQIKVDLTALLPGAQITLPLSSISGTIALDQGQAIANLTTPVGNFPVSFDFAAEVGETLFDFLTNISGTLAIGDGFLTANLSTDLGSFQGTLNVGQYVSDFIATIPQYQGSLTFAGGAIAANLTTPDGTVNEFLNYGQYLDTIALLIGDLNL
jgi:hypothetical protein